MARKSKSETLPVPAVFGTIDVAQRNAVALAAEPPECKRFDETLIAEDGCSARATPARVCEPSCCSAAQELLRRRGPEMDEAWRVTRSAERGDAGCARGVLCTLRSDEADDRTVHGLHRGRRRARGLLRHRHRCAGGDVLAFRNEARPDSRDHRALRDRSDGRPARAPVHADRRTLRCGGSVPHRSRARSRAVDRGARRPRQRPARSDPARRATGAEGREGARTGYRTTDRRAFIATLRRAIATCAPPTRREGIAISPPLAGVGARILRTKWRNA